MARKPSAEPVPQSIETSQPGSSARCEMLGRLKRLAGWLVSGRQAGLFQLVNGAQLDDFEFFRAGRCRNFYFIPDLAVEERAADRRRRRNMALFDVSFFAA